MIEKFKSEDDGVSPVIGVILLVAVTVALVALATVIVFDIGSDVSETADATVQLNQVTDGVQATIVRNENVASFTLAGPYTDTEISEADSSTDPDFSASQLNASSVGDTALYPSEIDASSGTVTLGDGETVSVIATLEDGTEEVLTSTDYEA